MSTLPRKNISFVTFFILIILLGLKALNSLVVFTNQISTDYDIRILSENINIIIYTSLIIVTFPALTIIIKSANGILENLGLDHFYLLLFAIAGFIQLYYFPYTIFTALSLFYIVPVLFESKANVNPINNNLWRIIGFIGILFGLVLIVLLHSYNHNENSMIIFFLVESTPGAIYEEAIFRGVLFTLLMSLGVSRTHALIVQGVLFWLFHISYLPAFPIFFWIIIPSLSFILSYIVFQKKSLAASSIVHILFNYIFFLYQT